MHLYWLYCDKAQKYIFMDHRYAIVIFTVSLRSYADAVIDPIDVMGVVKKRMYRSSCTAVTSKGNEGLWEIVRVIIILNGSY